VNGPISWFSSTRRLIRILWTVRRFGLDELVVSGAASSSRSPWLLRMTRWLRMGTIREPRGVRLRMAFESLGPIFVKFGQVLSTRRDLLPPDIANELALLQDRVPPFPADQAVAEIERGLEMRLEQAFAEFGREPIASASIAAARASAFACAAPVTCPPSGKRSAPSSRFGPASPSVMDATPSGALSSSEAPRRTTVMFDST